MLTKLQLSNFGRFIDRTVTFTDGLNAMLGANEAGKSTLLSAINYAWFGANALELPLVEYIHWGRHASLMKVEVWQTIAGVEYYAKRGPSGAEIRYADQSVTGQVEVTKFFEKLLGTKAAVASRLFVAAQADLKGVAAGTGTQASQLIERLSNLDLVDSLIEDIAKHNPHGDVSDREIALAAAQTELSTLDLTAPDLSPLTAQVDARLAQMGDTLAQIKGVEQGIAGERTALAQLTRELSVSQAEIASRNAAQEAVRVAQADLLTAQTTAAAVPTFPADYAAILQARKAKVDQTRRLAKGHAEVLDFNSRVDALVYPVLPEGSSLIDHYERSRTARLTAEKEAQALRIASAELRGQLITATACGLCGKDLTEVPEVVATNSRLQTQIEQNSARIAGLTKTAIDAGKAEAECTLFDRAWSDILANSGVRTAELQAAQVPHLMGTFKYSWTGSTDFTVDTQVDADQTAYTWAVAQRQAAEVSEQRAATRLAQAQAAAAAPAKSRAPAQVEGELSATNERITTLAGQLAALNADHSAQRTALAEAHAAIAAKQQAHAAVCRQAQGCKQRIDMQETAIAKVVVANGLLSAMKKAKPILTEQIWNACLSAIGQYFSGIRGTPSVVSRSEGKFLIDGRPAAAYSGSTKDALGLAVRIALTQVFVPGTPLMVLDEPGAACDEGREASMLGVIAAAGFKQVLLVTHSEVANAHASNIIEV